MTHPHTTTTTAQPITTRGYLLALSTIVITMIALCMVSVDLHRRWQARGLDRHDYEQRAGLGSPNREQLNRIER